VLSSKKIVTALKRAGFSPFSQKGRHLKLKNQHRVVIVPLHNEIARGTLQSIMEQAELPLDTFLTLL
jgi:predicted RNA binding protein YcfA (HicA-like mRNA interferase family)